MTKNKRTRPIPTQAPPVAWRDGDLLAALKSAQLPPRCVRTDQAVEKTNVARNFCYSSWLLRRTGRVEFALGGKWARKYRSADLIQLFAIGGGLALLGGCFFPAAIFPRVMSVDDRVALLVLFMTLGLVVLAGISQLFKNRATGLTAVKIDRHFVWPELTPITTRGSPSWSFRGPASRLRTKRRRMSLPPASGGKTSCWSSANRPGCRCGAYARISR